MEKKLNYIWYFKGPNFLFLKDVLKWFIFITIYQQSSYWYYSFKWLHRVRFGDPVRISYFFEVAMQFIAFYDFLTIRFPYFSWSTHSIKVMFWGTFFVTVKLRFLFLFFGLRKGSWRSSFLSLDSAWRKVLQRVLLMFLMMYFIRGR